MDLVIALASGTAGVYAISKSPKSATLPGVAIATALMPPLCVVGIGLAKFDLNVATGALLLFLANVIAINVAAMLTFKITGFTRQIVNEQNEDKRFSKNIFPILLLLFISIPLAMIMFKTYNENRTQKIIHSSLLETLNMIEPNSSIVSSSYLMDKNDDKYLIQKTFRTAGIITPKNIRQMENLLELKLGKPVEIESDVVFVQKVNNEKNIDSFSQFLTKIK